MVIVYHAPFIHDKETDTFYCVDCGGIDSKVELKPNPVKYQLCCSICGTVFDYCELVTKGD